MSNNHEEEVDRVQPLVPSYDAELSARIANLKALLDKQCHDHRRPRIILTISGIPGSGKTTLANHVAAQFAKSTDGAYTAVVISMDGYHLPRSQLDAEGLRRRGAPFTFDAHAVVDLVERLRSSCLHDDMPDIKVPSFDHAIKDPVADDIVVHRSTNLIIMEGNYLLLKDAPWNRIHDLVDDTWLLGCPEDVAVKRLSARHLAAGIVPTLEEGRERSRFNDMPNGAYLLDHSFEPAFYLETKAE